MDLNFRNVSKIEPEISRSDDAYWFRLRVTEDGYFTDGHKVNDVNIWLKSTNRDDVILAICQLRNNLSSILGEFM